jgi:hypothetical protein
MPFEAGKDFGGDALAGLIDAWKIIRRSEARGDLFGFLA